MVADELICRGADVARRRLLAARDAPITPSNHAIAADDSKSADRPEPLPFPDTNRAEAPQKSTAGSNLCLRFSDGKKIGARLDRTGLRPARFWQTDDGYVYVASEVGVLGDTLESASKVVAKGRLGPGQMLIAELVKGEFSTNIDNAKPVAA